MTCPRCLKRYPANLPGFVGGVDDQRELAGAVAQANATLEGGAGDEGFRRYRRDAVSDRPTPGGDCSRQGTTDHSGYRQVGGSARVDSALEKGGVDEREKKEEVEVGREGGGQASGDLYESIAYAVLNVSPQKDLAMAIATELTARLGEFTTGDFAKAAKRAMLRGDPGEWLERMSLDSRLTEPSAGRYRAI